MKEMAQPYAERAIRWAWIATLRLSQQFLSGAASAKATNVVPTKSEAARSFSFLDSSPRSQFWSCYGKIDFPRSGCRRRRSGTYEACWGSTAVGEDALATVDLQACCASGGTSRSATVPKRLKMAGTLPKNSSLAAMSCYMLFECQPCLFWFQAGLVCIPVKPFVFLPRWHADFLLEFRDSVRKYARGALIDSCQTCFFFAWHLGAVEPREILLLFHSIHFIQTEP